MDDLILRRSRKNIETVNHRLEIATNKILSECLEFPFMAAMLETEADGVTAKLTFNGLILIIELLRILDNSKR